jgi:hypothetical protein
LAAGQRDSLLTALTPARVALRINGLAIPVTCAISVKLTPGRSSITPSIAALF